MSEFDQTVEDQAPRDPARMYNIITAAMLAFTVIACCAIVTMAVTWPRTPSINRGADIPTLVPGVPTFTPRAADPTLNPTWTATQPEVNVTTQVPEATTPAPGDTAQPTDTPTPTGTPMSTETGTATETGQPTNTAEPQAATATNTRAPFDYVLRNGQITYTKNFANSAECNWAGIAGTVIDINGQHQTGLLVHVYGAGIDERVLTGSFTAYGASGWERSVNNAPSTGEFFAQLESASGTLLSDVIAIQMVDSCDQNLALLIFEQVQQ